MTHFRRYTLTVEIYDDSRFYGRLENEEGEVCATEAADSLPDLLTRLREHWSVAQDGTHPLDWVKEPEPVAAFGPWHYGVIADTISMAKSASVQHGESPKSLDRLIHKLIDTFENANGGFDAEAFRKRAAI